MSSHRFKNDLTIPITVGSIEASGSGIQQSRERLSDLEDVDQQGDAIFRFQLEPLAMGDQLTLAEFYRQHLHDLFKIVRFYYRGAPVIVDAFAFLNNPEELLPILPPDQSA